MRRAIAVLSIPALLAAGILAASRVTAGPDKVAFPAGYAGHVLYATVDRYDSKQYRELYATPEAVQAARDGKPLPHGTVLTMVVHKARVDDKGVPIKDANGRFVKGDLQFVSAMEKRAGWGAEYPPELRNGEWEYATFGLDRKLNEKANYKACFECHKPHESIDFVISYPRMAGTRVAALPASAPADVTITGFAFGPSKLSGQSGKPVTWLNQDDSPHMIVVPGAKLATGMLAKGQSGALTFGTPGTYDYICGLHPAMKGSVEVK